MTFLVIFVIKAGSISEADMLSTSSQAFRWSRYSYLYCICVFGGRSLDTFTYLLCIPNICLSQSIAQLIGKFLCNSDILYNKRNYFVINCTLVFGFNIDQRQAYILLKQNVYNLLLADLREILTSLQKYTMLVIKRKRNIGSCLINIYVIKIVTQKLIVV